VEALGVLGVSGVWVYSVEAAGEGVVVAGAEVVALGGAVPLLPRVEQVRGRWSRRSGIAAEPDAVGIVGVRLVRNKRAGIIAKLPP
jgi:hypothetical protein